MLLFHGAAPYLEAGREDTKDFQRNHWFQAMDWPAHLHAQAEMIYVKKGALDVLIDNQTHVMRAGDYAIAFPHSIHAYRPADGEPDEADVFFYVFNPHMVGDYADKIHAYMPMAPFVDAADLPEEARFALDRLALLKGESFRINGVKAYLQIVVDYTWSLIDPQKEEERNRDLPYRALKYVAENFRQPITVESVAKELCISKNYLSSVFSKKLNIPFHQCLHIFRIERARDLLRNTDKPITAILYECGYGSPCTFNRVFIDLCGITPREYRAQYQS